MCRNVNSIPSLEFERFKLFVILIHVIFMFVSMIVIMSIFYWNTIVGMVWIKFKVLFKLVSFQVTITFNWTWNPIISAIALIISVEPYIYYLNSFIVCLSMIVVMNIFDLDLIIPAIYLLIFNYFQSDFIISWNSFDPYHFVTITLDIKSQRVHKFNSIKSIQFNILSFQFALKLHNQYCYYHFQQ